LEKVIVLAFKYFESDKRGKNLLGSASNLTQLMKLRALWF